MISGTRHTTSLLESFSVQSAIVSRHKAGASDGAVSLTPTDGPANKPKTDGEIPVSVHPLRLKKTNREMHIHKVMAWEGEWDGIRAGADAFNIPLKHCVWIHAAHVLVSVVTATFARIMIKVTS